MLMHWKCFDKRSETFNFGKNAWKTSKIPEWIRQKANLSLVGRAFLCWSWINLQHHAVLRTTFLLTNYPSFILSLIGNLSNKHGDSKTEHAPLEKKWTTTDCPPINLPEVSDLPRIIKDGSMKSLEEKLNYKHIKAISICETEFPLFGKIRWILLKLITIPVRDGNRSVRRPYEKKDRFFYSYTQNAHKRLIPKKEFWY